MELGGGWQLLAWGVAMGRGCDNATDHVAGAALGARVGGARGEGLSGRRAQYNSV